MRHEVGLSDSIHEPKSNHERKQFYMGDSYKIFVKDMANFQQPGEFRIGLEGMFDQVCQSNETSFLSSTVLFTTGGIEDHEVLIYLLKSKAQSRIKKVAPSMDLGKTSKGNTLISSQGNISEIYTSELSDWKMSDIVNLAFHELMHNKLQVGDDLHTDYGFGLAAGDVTGRTLNERNIEDMAKALATKVPQRII